MADGAADGLDPGRAGKPLRTFDTMLDYLRGTTTTTGLKVTQH
jgi:hypothetical protein